MRIVPGFDDRARALLKVALEAGPHKRVEDLIVALGISVDLPPKRLIAAIGRVLDASGACPPGVPARLARVLVAALEEERGQPRGVDLNSDNP